MSDGFPKTGLNIDLSSSSDVRLKLDKIKAQYEEIKNSDDPHDREYASYLTVQIQSLEAVAAAQFKEKS